MRRLLAFLVLCAAPAVAQPPIFVGGGGSGGSVAPGSFSSPTGTITVGGSVGAVTIDADTTVIPTYATGTSLPATCTPFASTFGRTDTHLPHACINTDLWAQLVTVTDDSVLVGTGTTTASKAIPDCDDTTGQHLNYDTATNAFSCGTSGSSGFDPSTTLYIYEDFPNASGTTGQIGTHGWRFVAAATGTISADVADAAAHPGLVRINSHATNDNSGANIHLGNQLAMGTGWFSREWSLDFVFVLGSNSTAITNVGFYVGLSVRADSTLPNAASGGLWVRYDSDDSDATFKFQACSSATNGCDASSSAAHNVVVASTVTPSAGTYYRFRIRRVASGVGGNPTIYLRVNNETEVTLCSSGCDGSDSTLPSGGSLVPMVSYVTRTTTGVLSGDIDYAAISITGLTRY